jgi:antimicrobial peptide system SdpA family protein
MKKRQIPFTRLKGQGTIWLFSVGVWAIFISGFALLSIPNHPFIIPKKYKLLAQNFMPEGWSFFTKSPREESIYFLSEKDGTLDYRNQTNSSAYGWFGLKKNVRIQAIEIGILTKQLSQKAWKDFEGPVEEMESMVDTMKTYTLLNTMQKPSLCGEWILQRKPPVPWAWSPSKEKIFMPSKIVKINVVCFDQ